MDGNKKLVLIDGHAMLYRAWFAFPQTLTRRDGVIINAVYGFTRILLNVIGEMKPEYLVVSFDVGKTFRHEQYKEYKAHREKMPDELKAQEPIVNEVLAALNVPIQTKEGFEADDIIGTLAVQASGREARSPSTKLRTGTKPFDNAQDKHEARRELETVIVTGDKDTLQLVKDPFVRVYMPGRGMKGPVLYDEAGVVADLGITASQVPDFKGLAGDSSDNIPGVRGVGPKGAVRLLSLFGSIENMYEAIDTGFKNYDLRFKNEAQLVLKPGLLTKLDQGRESAIESKRLATIVTDVPLEFSLEACRVREYDKDKALAVFEELGFQSLMRKLPNDAFEESVQEALF